MRDPKRIMRVLVALTAAWHAHPDLRLGQLLLNLTLEDEDLYNLEDIILRRRLQRLYLRGNDE